MPPALRSASICHTPVPVFAVQSKGASGNQRISEYRLWKKRNDLKGHLQTLDDEIDCGRCRKDSRGTGAGYMRGLVVTSRDCSSRLLRKQKTVLIHTPSQRTGHTLHYCMLNSCWIALTYLMHPKLASTLRKLSRSFWVSDVLSPKETRVLSLRREGRRFQHLSHGHASIPLTWLRYFTCWHSQIYPAVFPIFGENMWKYCVRHNASLGR